MRLSLPLSFAALLFSAPRATFAAPTPSAAVQSINLVRRSASRPVDLETWAQAQRDRLKNKYGVPNHNTKRNVGVNLCVSVTVLRLTLPHIQVFDQHCKPER